MRIDYESATLAHLYARRTKVIAHVTTCDYQHVRMKSEAALPDWFTRQSVTFRELARFNCEL
jgi:hypothetical protein